MKIAAAQINPIQNDTLANIQNHIQMIDEAAMHGVELIVFPEMSLTGYEREGAAAMAFNENDNRLTVFKQKAMQHQMHIIAGAPILIEGALNIGAFVFLPNGTHTIYSKQYLHEGEEKFFTTHARYNPLITIQEEKVAIAICADIAQPMHAEMAFQRGATLYVAGIFYTPNGIQEGFNQMQQYAGIYHMKTLMANFVGSSYQLEAAGNSACWDQDGRLLQQLDAVTQGLLIVDI